MADRPINPIVRLTKNEASRIVSAWLGEETVVTRLRRLFYWLNTLLLHVRAFKTTYYAQAATDLIRRLAAAV
ncbi:MAG: hypothetical protein FJX75_26985 [Armatimonadetes bacterium]|nr:hypothetical protein [Armatimonadota bacterium]